MYISIIKSFLFLLLLNATRNPPLFRDCSVNSQKYEKKAFMWHHHLHRFNSCSKHIAPSFTRLPTGTAAFQVPLARYK